VTPVTAADLDRWEALAAAATPGPWERDITGHIATSRTAVAALVAALREALETNARLNRRSQIAEAAIADLTREPVGGRKHRSVAAEVWERCEESHGLACATTMRARGTAAALEAELAELREQIEHWCAEVEASSGSRVDPGGTMTPEQRVAEAMLGGHRGAGERRHLAERVLNAVRDALASDDPETVRAMAERIGLTDLPPGPPGLRRANRRRHILATPWQEVPDADA